MHLSIINENNFTSAKVKLESYPIQSKKKRKYKQTILLLVCKYMTSHMFASS